MWFLFLGQAGRKGIDCEPYVFVVVAQPIDVSVGM